MRWRQQENEAPSAHECPKPLEARSLLIDKGEKGTWFGHHDKGFASVLDQSVSCVRWAGSTWEVGRFNVGAKVGFVRIL